jgi:hypothetical protein
MDKAMTEQIKLQPCDFLVSVNDRIDLWSSLERWAIGPYEHAFLYLGELGLFAKEVREKYPALQMVGIPMIFESVPMQGVCLRQLRERYGETVEVMRLFSEHDRRRIPHILHSAIKLASDDQAYYDFFCIPLHIIPRILNEKFGMPIPVKYHRNPQQVCSEALNEVSIRGGLPDILLRCRQMGIVPMPGDFVTGSPLLRKVGRVTLSAEVI